MKEQGLLGWGSLAQWQPHLKEHKMTHNHNMVQAGPPSTGGKAAISAVTSLPHRDMFFVSFVQNRWVFDPGIQ